MIFAKVDLVLLSHRKAFEAGPEAMGLWLFCLAYTRDQELDGFVPDAIVRAAWGGRSNLKLADRLVGADLLQRVDGGYIVVRYAQKNDTKADVQRRKREEADRKAAFRAKKRTGVREESGRSPLGVPVGHAWESHGSPAGVRDTEPEPEPEPEPDFVLSAPAAPATPEPAKRVERRRPKTHPPEFGSEAEWAKRWDIPADHGEFEAFVDYFRREGKACSNWTAAWRTWLRNAKRFATRTTGVRAIQPAEPDAPWLKALGGDGWTT